MVDNYQPHLVTRYVHNLLVIHFNAGESIVFAVNDAMRSFLDLGHYCPNRATKYTPHFHLYVGGTYVFFPTARELQDHFRQGRIDRERCLALNFDFRRITMSVWSNGTTSDYICLEQNDFGETIYIVDRHVLTRITERQFCFEIDKFFEKFAQLCKNAE